MSKFTKIMMITMIVAGALIVVGSGMIGLGIAIGGENLFNMGTQKAVNKTYDIDEDFDDIVIDNNIGEVELVLSEDDECKVKTHEYEKNKFDVSVKDGALTIKERDTSAWYDHVGFSIFRMKVTVYLPAKEYKTLRINTDTGDISVPDGFTFENATIKSDTGKITVGAQVDEMLSAETDTGNIAIGDLQAGILKVSTDTGKISVENVIVNEKTEVSSTTGNIMFNGVQSNNIKTHSTTGGHVYKNVIAAGEFYANSSTGDIRFDGSDGADLRIKTSTGDVSGVLLSKKVFITKTSTGKVDVVQSEGAAFCYITTSTGDITITTK